MQMQEHCGQSGLIYERVINVLCCRCVYYSGHETQISEPKRPTFPGFLVKTRAINVFFFAATTSVYKDSILLKVEAATSFLHKFHANCLNYGNLLSEDGSEEPLRGISFQPVGKKLRE